MSTQTKNHPRIRRPFAGIAVSFAGGIWLGSIIQPAPIVVGAAACAVALLALALPSRFSRSSLAAALAAVSLAGAFLTSVNTPPPADIASLSSRNASVVTRVRGTVGDLPDMRILDRDEGSGRRVLLRFPLHLSELMIDGEWTPAGGGVMISAIEEPDLTDPETRRISELRYGDEVELALALSPPSGPSNPGEFDYGDYLLRRSGTYALGSSPVIISRTPGSSLSLKGLIGEARRAMRDYLESRLPPSRAALLRTILLGERYALSPEQVNAYMLSGAVHFLVVSGLHVGLLALAVWYILIPAGAGPRATAIVVILIATFYAALAGLRPPVFRAALMTAVVCGGHILRRRPDPLNSICLAALVLLVIRPDDLFDGGFIMSFTAVAGIILFTEPIRGFLFGARDPLEETETVERRGRPFWRIRDYGERGVSVSLAAWISVAPLAAYYFNTVTPATFIFNLAAAPIICLLLAFGFPAAILGPALGGYVEPFILAAGSMAGALEALVAVFSSAPGARFFIGDFPWISAAVFYAFVLFILAAGRWEIRSGLVWICGLIAGAAMLWGAAFPAEPRPSFSVMDVGHGTATLLQLPGGANIIYDCGGARGSGEWVMAPFLHSRRVGRIDAVIISHPHDDHFNGLETILERFRVGRIILPRGFGAMEGGSEMLALLRRHRLPAYTKAAGDSLLIGDDMVFQALHPQPGSEWIERLSANDASLVMRFSGAGLSIMLTGDIEGPGVAMLVHSGVDLRSDILLTPHHGRASPNLDMLLGAIEPKIVLSSGLYIDDIYRSGDWRLYDTAEFGAIMVRPDKNGRLEVFAGAMMNPIE